MAVKFSEEEEKQFKTSGEQSYVDGDYIGTLIAAEVKEFGQERKKRLVLKYLINHPASYVGKVFVHYLTLDMPSIYWVVKKAVAALGIDTRELALAHLEEAVFDRVSKVEVQFNLKTDKKGYQNASILGSLPSVTGSKNEDDVPY